MLMDCHRADARVSGDSRERDSVLTISQQIGSLAEEKGKEERRGDRAAFRGAANQERDAPSCFLPAPGGSAC